MHYALTSSVTLGNPFNGVKTSTVSSLELLSMFIDFGPYLTNAGQATLVVVLRDPVSGYMVNVKYQSDSTALAFWNSVGSGIPEAIMNKLIADGKLPAGSLILDPATPVATAAAVAPSTAATSAAPSVAAA